MHDPELAEGVQHAWKRDKSNIKAEIEWSQLRRRWSAGFEDILEEGAALRNFDRMNPLQVLLFRYLFIPWIQTELDHHRRRINNFAKRANVHKLTPVGVPVDIHFRPHEKGARDFKVTLSNGAVAAARQEYTDEKHRVFQMVPTTFNEAADAIWTGLGIPLVNHLNVWMIYSDMLEQLEVSIQLGIIPMEVVRTWAAFVEGTTTEGDRAQVEAEEMNRGAQFPVDGDAPHGFRARGGPRGRRRSVVFG